MATTPFLMALTKPLRRNRQTTGRARGAAQADQATAIIVGYGRFGQTVAQMLLASEISVTLIDTDIEMIDIAGGFGAKVYFGDGTRLDLLRQAGAEEAADHVLHGWRSAEPDMIEACIRPSLGGIYVRAYDRRALIRLKGRRCAHRARGDGIGGQDGPPRAGGQRREHRCHQPAEDMYRTRDRER
jgi:CPA2 family monovalent cation:H+ antiporter-2/glutathione-regulated potassium-efflux system protein KefB